MELTTVWNRLWKVYYGIDFEIDCCITFDEELKEKKPYNTCFGKKFSYIETAVKKRWGRVTAKTVGFYAEFWKNVGNKEKGGQNGCFKTTKHTKFSKSKHLLPPPIYERTPWDEHMRVRIRG